MSLLLYPLHGSMPTAQQRGIFDRPPPGQRKVVIATNIAESSITIEDVVWPLHLPWQRLATLPLSLYISLALCFLSNSLSLR